MLLPIHIILLQIPELIEGADKVSPYTPYVYSFLVLLLVVTNIFTFRYILKLQETNRADLEKRDEELKKLTEKLLTVLTEVGVFIKQAEKVRESTSKLLTLMQEGIIRITKE